MKLTTCFFLLILTIAKSYSRVYFQSSMHKQVSSFSKISSLRNRTTAIVDIPNRLSLLETIFVGAISRSISQTAIHPILTIKTITQLRRLSDADLSLSRLMKGADAQFLLSLPHGALHYSIVNSLKHPILAYLPKSLKFIGDFAASACSTLVCSSISTPQMVITDRLMAGRYSSFHQAIKEILKTEGIRGFYTGWWPALAQKIPSYGLTWMFFQQLKRLHERLRSDNLESESGVKGNFIIAAAASTAAVCVMNPLDTIKTRLVTQAPGGTAYQGICDCFCRMVREEGYGSLYASLPPRLLSVVPMMALQLSLYEYLQCRLVELNHRKQKRLEESPGYSLS